MGDLVGLITFLLWSLRVSKVLNRFVLADEAIQTFIDLEFSLCLILAVVEVCPELFKAIEMAIVIVSQRQFLEISKDFLAVTLFKAVGIEAEETLQTISVVLVGILDRQLLELIVHALVEVITQEVGPEAEKSVHFLRLANTQSLALLQCLCVVLVVLVLDKTVFSQQLMARMLKVRERMRDIQGRGKLVEGW